MQICMKNLIFFSFKFCLVHMCVWIEKRQKYIGNLLELGIIICCFFFSFSRYSFNFSLYSLHFFWYILYFSFSFETIALSNYSLIFDETKKNFHSSFWGFLNEKCWKISINYGFWNPQILEKSFKNCIWKFEEKNNNNNFLL